MALTEADAVSGITPALVWLPLVAATLFSVGALLLKRSGDWKIDVWRTTFVSNMLTALAFVPLLSLGGSVPSWGLVWQPFVVALLFVVGQVTTVLALTRGEVSIAAPILGLKILLVAFFSRVLLGRGLPENVWLASLLATAGVMLLNAGGRGAARGNVRLSLVCAGVAAVAFGLFDVAVQAWSPGWGTGRFLPVMLGFAAILSLGFIFRFEGSLGRIPKKAWPWLGGGGALIALQSLTFVYTVATWGRAAEANVVYSTRGLWSVLLVWGMGPWIGVRDAGLKGRVVVYRLAGAVLLLVGIAVMLVG